MRVVLYSIRVLTKKRWINAISGSAHQLPIYAIDPTREKRQLYIRLNTLILARGRHGNDVCIVGSPTFRNRSRQAWRIDFDNSRRDRCWQFWERTRSQALKTGTHIFNSLHGVQVVGYQGWYDCPGDGAGVGWGHWFVAGSNTKDPNSIAFDEWPDTSELGPDERCPTDFKLPSNAPAYLFSNQNPKTVARHFRWMKDNDIDGAAMQQFTVSLNNAVGRHFDIVLRNARGGAEANGRGFFVMYDISGMNGAAALEAITKDWPHLTGDLRVADSPSYIYHRGKPVVGVWGLGFKDRDVTPDQAAAIIHFLKTASVPATVLGGVPTSWRNLGIDSRWPDARPESGWAAVYRSLDVISPWSVGRFRDDEAADNFGRFRVIPDLAETRRLGIDYMPVVFPGFSWHHGAGRATNSPLNAIPRRCGDFYRHQISNIIKAGADML